MSGRLQLLMRAQCMSQHCCQPYLPPPAAAMQVTRRSESTPAAERIETSEYIEQVFDNSSTGGCQTYTRRGGGAR